MAPEKKTLFMVFRMTVATDRHHDEAASLAHKYVKKSFRISETPRVCLTKTNGQCHNGNAQSTGEQPPARSSNRTLSVITP
jgi:hypothetical protein